MNFLAGSTFKKTPIQQLKKRVKKGKDICSMWWWEDRVCLPFNPRPLFFQLTTIHIATNFFYSIFLQYIRLVGLVVRFINITDFFSGYTFNAISFKIL
jgi:hypothetical protein